MQEEKCALRGEGIFRHDAYGEHKAAAPRHSQASLRCGFHISTSEVN